MYPDIYRTHATKYSYAAFCLVCNLIKPITTENNSYPSKRYNTALKSVGLDFQSMSQVASANSYSQLGISLSPYIEVKSVFQALSTPHPNPTKATTAIRTQITMIYKDAGMVLIEEMHKYATSAPNAGITDPNVADQAVMFEAIRTEIKDESGEEFPDLRSTHPEVLTYGESAVFPNLHYCTIRTIKKAGKYNNLRSKVHSDGMLSNPVFLFSIVPILYY